MPDYMHYQVLSGMDDVFSATSLWQAPGFALFSRKPGLRDLLERWPREMRGKTMTRCFCHVVLSLPQEILEDDAHLARGSRARELQLALQQRHQTDFGDLLDGDEVRYQLVADSKLMPDEVGVRFGHAVYIPATDEARQGRLRFSTDGQQWTLLGAVYPGQRVIQLCADPVMSSFQISDWPFDPDAPVLLINDGTRCHLRTKGKMRSEIDDAHSCFRLQLDRQSCYVKYEPDAGIRAASIWKPRPANCPQISQPATGATALAAIALRATGTMERYDKTPVNDEGGDQTKLTTPVSADEATALPQQSIRRPTDDLTWVPVPRRSSRLSLVGLALPRLDGYQQLGLESLEIGFNRQLQICMASDALLRIRVNLDNQIRVGNNKGWKSVALPSQFAPFQEDELRLAPCHPALQERYCATLSLPHEISVPLCVGQPYLFGRGVSHFADLCVLDAPHFLHPATASHAATGVTAPASADQLGLSRRAFRFEAGQDGLLITRDAPNQVLYHLDKQCQWMSSMDQGTQSWLLPNGHHLVAGNYVLRYDA